MTELVSYDVKKLDKPSPDQLIEKFRQWLMRKAPESVRGQLVGFKNPSDAAGRSGDTYIVEIAHEDPSKGQHKYILRAELGSTCCPESSFDNMVIAHKVLGAIEGLPVPSLVYHEEDVSVLGGPFFMMEFCEGIAASDSPPFTTTGWLFDSTPEQQRSICLSGIDFLVSLHELDWRASGLDTLLRNGAEKTQVEQHLKQLIDIHDSALDGKRHETGAAAIDWLSDNIPEAENLCMVWGDCRPGNALWKDHKLSAVLDWEMCGISEPGIDIGLWLLSETALSEYIGVPRLPGMLQRNEFLDEYEKRAKNPVKNFAFYELLSAFRAYTILVDMIKLYERQGQHLFGPDIDVTNFPHAFALQEMLANY